MTSLLTLESVTLKFGGLTALSDVTLDIPRQGIHGIIGPNGAGKSTLFNVVSGLYKPTEGKILFDRHKDVQKRKMTEIARLGLARTFQNIRLLPHLTVIDNLCVVTAMEREGTFWKSLFHHPQAKKKAKEIRQRAEMLLELVGLSHVCNHYPSSLPYGCQRKLEIARALMSHPKLLMLDEPAAGMNPVEKASLEQILRKILEQKITILIIEHDMKFIMNLCHHIIVLNQGAICATGTPAEIQKNPHVIEIYLGGVKSSHLT